MTEAPSDKSPPSAKRMFQPDAVILIVEDELIIAWDVEQAFRDSGVTNVLVASSLKSARLLLSSHAEIAAAIIDLKLEDGSGTELIAELTSRKIPMIITTGYDYAGDGSLLVVYKPYSADDIVDAVFDSMGN